MRPPKRIDIFGIDEVERSRSSTSRDIVEARARVDHECAVSAAFDLRRFALVMLVFDIADDHFDDIFDRGEAVGAAIFVDDERHMRARRLHFDEKIERRHGRRREQDRPQNAGFRERHFGKAALARLRRVEFETVRHLGDEIDEVADMDHAARIVEIFGINRQTRMAGGAKRLEHFREARIDGRRR